MLKSTVEYRRTHQLTGLIMLLEVVATQSVSDERSNQHERFGDHPILPIIRSKIVVRQEKTKKKTKKRKNDNTSDLRVQGWG